MGTSLREMQVFNSSTTSPTLVCDSRPQIFFDSCVHPHGMTQSDQSLHGKQTGRDFLGPLHPNASGRAGAVTILGL